MPKIVCAVCQAEDWDSEDMSFGLCLDCRRRFVDDCLNDWIERQAWLNEVIGDYRRAELAYHDEYDYCGPSKCDRCGDGDMVGYRDYIVFPDSGEFTVCYSCYLDWKAAADVDGDGAMFMSPAAVARFQWQGVEGRYAKLMRQQRERKAVMECQGGVCADCGFKPVRELDYLLAEPKEQTDGFRMICQPCAGREY